MGRNGKVDYSGILAIRDEIEKNLSGQELQNFIDSCAKELAARLLAKVVKRTPVGNYHGEEYTCTKADTGRKHTSVEIPGKKGGTLRKGWTAGKNQSTSAYAQEIKVHHTGSSYVIEIVNPVEYASYVEYGHKQTPGRYVPLLGKSLKKGWVEGHFMLTISEKEIQRDAPKILENKLKKKLGEIFN